METLLLPSRSEDLRVPAAFPQQLPAGRRVLLVCSLAVFILGEHSQQPSGVMPETLPLCGQNWADLSAPVHRALCQLGSIYYTGY